MNQDADDFDSPWKDALIHAFPDFMAFYFPRAAAQIDWSAGYTFLDQELRQVVRDAELGRRRLDVLVRVSDRDGSEHWLYIHVEIQSQRDDQLPERLYIYNYRLYDRYRRPIATLVVLADPSPTWKPRSFRARSLGCQIAMRFPVAKLMDARDRLEALLADPNPFALITAAHLLTQQTHGNHAERYTVKWRLARLLYQRRWERQRIIDLFAIIDWMMQLPKDLEHQLWQQLETLERNTQMRYVTSVERIGIEKGLQQGAADVLLRQMERRFGPLDDGTRARIAEADSEHLLEWSDRILDAQTLNDVLH
ncbi:DUF4351 domain-containing protein [Thiorhodovibrio frisius]|uniref:Putative transposase, YhgA n=1 Tax=Thiorhodovibrio frisius TaxID=631362 RepID=H8YWB1_9GAMM|nr:DUF4351 domain-containing protein [Thiorhodovibrio frisius]EIC23714.1 Putative transposase, YhgA [Thiorhodovibrio frisius]WPL20104.1 hypothetical protein Thiofri_00160 [Thiorhodovibrio frisius]